ncbi:CbtA family protein [Acidipropionibacterium jensenii]|uniref:Predicted integral membrane protein n=1 Tax=Acidipropionibacterium jensenii TaxID=1749 RepID=A0A3S4UY15_9ACTN|nr:CbtA family protein [Acidipropionibacterium jensenii]MDN5978302.1 CbtA family protein [Acidipropionibacterium jensenii]MDN5995778.1 CbtA family protein [Acidipropionibacterium jensenii]MDN6020838.1 CbtA family protein [Acidipropionibacterium jensenii]MDN6426139.1 CbtA family protein [Acidipropionibacterium jensenii]MDN6441876.1 CbtA family protein [Acidipropionibacterium jensenii]
MLSRLTNRRIFGTGALAGAIAGFFAFIFARILVEPLIQNAIDYESARDAVQETVDKALEAAGKTGLIPPAGADVDIFTRGIQRNIGIATGMILIGVAFGLLMAAAYRIVLYICKGEPGLSIQMTVLLIGLLGWLSVYVVPALKYPANPPAIGHPWTIHARGNLYLGTVLISIVLMIVACYVCRALAKRMSIWSAVMISGLCFAAAMCIVFAVLPSLGSLAENTRYFGSSVTYGTGEDAVTLPVNTETPLALRDTNGTIVFPGFPADVLSRFRMYSVIAQAIIWLGGAWIMGAMLAWVPKNLRHQKSESAGVKDAEKETVSA